VKSNQEYSAVIRLLLVADTSGGKGAHDERAREPITGVWAQRQSP